ncbi:DUF551 domain-containing protein [Desertivirga xinjiangensis]|uniref:DUF551 domain-containing protein n=1 Tax=Desertivirga xinjiangensis TaxID=539206 RepID=UPI00210A7C68|nr:DUF551 domain-containing protein [Pedobacter xinjiangensis]
MKNNMDWTRVEDGLPDREMDLLVCTSTYYIGIGWYYMDTRQWDFEIQKHTEADLGEVTHWMPLPKPPEN